MQSRKSGARKTIKSAVSGQPQLTLARLILFTEAALRCFARPLFFAALFVALAWLGLFVKLYPFAHLAALIIFFVLFFGALGKAQRGWQTPSSSTAKRRVEEASGLAHRPLDVLEDRPTNMNADSQTLWQHHLRQAEEHVRHLRWPRWAMNCATYDPYRLRYAVAALLIVGLVVGWGALGSRIVAAINPALGKLPLNSVTLDAWITPPDYTHLAPIMIATPAGDRFQDENINVPQGSVLHAHIAEKDGDVPVLVANHETTEFSAEDDKDFGMTATLTSGDSITIRRGWMKLGSWKIRVVPDTAPQITFTDMPSATEHKDVRIAYDAKDDYGVTSVTLRVTPRETLFGISGDPMEFALASTDQKDMKRVDFKDLTAEPWAGLMVDLQLIATDAVGHKAESDKVAFTLPERIFFQPVARALIGERKKLLSNILDMQVRNETANLMAGLARQPTSFGGDPVVAMALRAGAVRLVLDRDAESALTVKDILWQAAVRIEDGATGMAEANLKQAQQDLADALDRNASEKDVQALIDRLHQALAQYLAQLSMRMAAHPTQANDLGQVMGSRTNMLTPQDLDRMLDQMKVLSASGEHSAAREELSKLQQLMENLQTQQPELTKEQQASLAMLKNLQAITKEQQALTDKTFQKSQNDSDSKPENKSETEKLASSQGAILGKLHDLISKSKDQGPLTHSAEAMKRAEETLHQGASGQAVTMQSEALKALQQAEDKMKASLGESLFALPGSTSAGTDPFGRQQGLVRDDGSVHVPDRFEALHIREILDEIQRRANDMTRPKTERDYIERLLQNF